jgi:hypothetical protein
MSKGYRYTHCRRGHLLEGDNIYIVPSSGGRQCKICKVTKRNEWNHSNNNKRRVSRNNSNKKGYDTLVTFLTGIKGLRGCFDCEQWFPPEFLQFDHVPERGKKVRAPNQFHFIGEKLLEELAKCDVVCSMCHLARTLHRNQYNTQLGMRRKR